jgi:HK97 family phage major capsid protein/HK97 family phage prohead protease
MQRAYSILEVKGVDDEKRIITGVATTPSPDRMGDIVEPLGVKFKNPMPLLWQHKSDKPVGTVKFDKPSKTGITFTAQLPNITESGALKDRVDEAWQSVKAGLVRAVSIGFRALEHAFMDDGGVRFIESEVLELSLVTIPANADATITAIKSLDAEIRAATGKKDSDDDRPKPPAPGTKRNKTVKAQEARTMKKSIADQISAFEATRQAKAAEMDTLMDTAADKGETLDAEQKEQYDTLEAEVKEIDEHLVRLRAREKRELAAAKSAKGSNAEEGSESRGGAERPRVQVMQPKLDKGIGFVRILAAKHLAKQSGYSPADIAKARGWGEEVEMVLRSPVAPATTGDSTWAAPLVVQQNLTNEFIDLLRASSIITRLPGIRRVPFNIKVPRNTTALTAGWVGEGSPKPFTKGGFDTVTLGFAKIAAITAFTQEQLKFSTPNIEAIVRDGLVQAITYQMDRDFLDPSKTAVTGVSPASITNGATSINASGITSDAFRADFAKLIRNYLRANYNLNGLVVVMTASQAWTLGSLVTDFGAPIFPGLGKDGGAVQGIPVITSENIAAVGGSPADGAPIVAINANDILLADDGGVDIDISTEASVQMDTAPDSPLTASTITKSLWQHNLVGVRAERFINWTKARSDSVQLIANANYSTAA